MVTCIGKAGAERVSIRRTARSSTVRKTWIVALAFTGSVALAGPASANSFGDTRLQMPGLACQGGSIWASVRGNWGPSTTDVWCPIQASWYPNAFIRPTNVWVDVSHGWATTSSCNFLIASDPTDWWYFAPNTVTNNTSYDTVSWNMSDTAETLGMEVECYLPPGGSVLADYQYRTSITFDWTSW